MNLAKNVQALDAFSREVAGTFIATNCLFEMVYAKEVKQPRLNGKDLLCLFEITRLLKKILKGRANLGEAYLVTEIIDPEIKEHLQFHPKWGPKERLEWFIKRIDECIIYLRFQVARDAFNESLKDLSSGLSLVLARINNHACDVEAHMYSLRDVRLLVKAIAKELEGFASSIP